MDGSNPMSGVLRALTRFPRKGRGRVLMLISAHREEGTSSVVRAVCDATGAATTLLLDLDLLRNAQFKAYQDQSLRDGPGLSTAVDGRLKGARLYRLMTPDGRVRMEERSALSYHRVGRSKLFVSSFDAHAVAEGDRTQILANATYWDAARQSCDLMLVDAPALERSRAGLTIAPHVDAVALVVSGADKAAAGAIGLKNELEAVNAPIAGLVYTRADPMALTLERLLPV
jgi:Mrp family chromosome partitioning ATPase